MDQVLTGGEQTISPFIVGRDSHPTLFFYLIRLFLAVFGYTIVGLRLPSVLAGTLAVAAMYGCVAVLSNRRVALIAAVLMAAYHFHIHWSRLALNNIWDTLWVPATIGLYAWGWKNRNSAGAALAGATLGFSQYFYQGGRLGVLLLTFVVVWLWWNDRDGQRLVIHLGKLAAVAVCIAGPLYLFAMVEPDPFLARFRVVLGWQPDAIQQATGSATDYWNFFWYQLARSVGAYTAYTDITGFYRPQIPLTIGLSMIMLPIGFGWAIFKRMWVPVVWLILATLFGGFLLGGAPSSSHYVIAIPAICWLIAIAIDLISEHGHPRVALAILVIIVLTDFIFYFGIYQSAPSSDLMLPFPPIPQLNP
jgi:4-amino-4-deoxy-L-arabinose transferase-like glycosyltransferase